MGSIIKLLVIIRGAPHRPTRAVTLFFGNDKAERRTVPPLPMILFHLSSTDNPRCYDTSIPWSGITSSQAEVSDQTKDLDGFGAVSPSNFRRRSLPSGIVTCTCRLLAFAAKTRSKRHHDVIQCHVGGYRRQLAFTDVMSYKDQEAVYY